MSGGYDMAASRQRAATEALTRAATILRDAADKVERDLRTFADKPDDACRYTLNNVTTANLHAVMLVQSAMSALADVHCIRLIVAREGAAA